MAKSKQNKTFKNEKPKGRMTNGLKVKLYNWSPIEYHCAGCDNLLGKNTMVVWLTGEYYCNWDCSDKSIK